MSQDTCDKHNGSQGWPGRPGHILQLNEPNDPPLVCQAELNVSVFRPQWPLHNSSPRPFKSFRPKRQSVCTHFQYSRHSSETFTGVGAFDLHSSPTKQVSLICPLVRRGGWDKGEQDGRAGMSPGGLAPYATLWTTLPHPWGTCGPVLYCTHTHQQRSDARSTDMYGSQDRWDLVSISSLTVGLGASTSHFLGFRIFIHLHSSARAGEGKRNIPSTSKIPQQSTRPDTY